ncbi:MAG: outer membrane protein assembly factor BamC [Betaproteobacteria bacterium]|nr:outer membrane protein assembly factor BamC [Betaproteobacteria bacterium]
MRSALLSARLRGGAILLAVCALSACSSFEALNDLNKVDYKGASKAPSLEVPPDLVRPGVSDRYTAFDRPADRTLSGFQASRAGPGVDRGVMPTVTGARLEKEGSGRVLLVVDLPIDKAWPIVKRFWQNNGFSFTVDRSDIGILETEWAENRARIPQDFLRRTIGRIVDGLYSSGERDKYRTRLDARGNATEILISHRGMQEVLIDRDSIRTQWQPRPSEPELEIEFTRRLLLQFGDSASQADEKIAQAANPRGPMGSRASGQDGTALASQARLRRDADGASLELAMNFDRAWRQVGLALERGGFTVEDRDRSQGIFYVRYIDPGLDREAPQRGVLAGLTSMFRSASGQAPKQYRMQLSAKDQSASVDIFDPKGQRLKGDEARLVAESMLKLLQEQLR